MRLFPGVQENSFFLFFLVLFFWGFLGFVFFGFLGIVFWVFCSGYFFQGSTYAVRPPAPQA